MLKEDAGISFGSRTVLPTASWDIGLLKDSNTLLGQTNTPSSPAPPWKARKEGPV